MPIRVCLAGATGWAGSALARSSAQPYVEGALLAIRKVNSFVGLRRGLDSILDLA
jgi:hypothetical protein